LRDGDRIKLRRRIGGEDPAATGRCPARRRLLSNSRTTKARLLRRKPLAPNEQGWHAAELGPLPEGVYRVTVFGGEVVEPVSDLVTVLAEQHTTGLSSSVSTSTATTT
jgi:hypothetical protein